MKHATSPQPASFAMLFDPALAREAAERAAQWNLPRRVCRPLDRYVGPHTNSELAAFDTEVECAPVAEEELHDEPQGSHEHRENLGPDFEDAADH